MLGDKHEGVARVRILSVQMIALAGSPILQGNIVSSQIGSKSQVSLRGKHTI
jgi:hypothetical protein